MGKLAWLLRAAWIGLALCAPAAGAQEPPKADGFLEGAAASALEEKIRVARIGADGEIEIRQTWTGSAAETVRAALSGPQKERLQKSLVAPYERRYPGLRTVAEPVFADDPVNNVLTSTMKLKSPTVARYLVLDARWRVNYEATNLREILRAPATTQHTQPIPIPFKATGRYSLEVQFPQEVSVITDPVTRTLKDDAFEFTDRRSFRGNRATAMFDLKVLEPQVDVKRIPAYLAALRRLDELERGSMYVDDEGIRIGGALSLGKPTVKDIQEKTQAERIERATRAIDQGRLRGLALAQAHCNRAYGLAYLGKPEEGLKDAQLAVKTSPDFPAPYVCRGDMHERLGNSAQAIEDFSRAIALAPDPSRAFYKRGLARYYAGQAELAEQDFTQARIDRTKSGVVFMHAAIWQAAALKLLGRAPDAELKRMAGADPRGEWPLPALALMNDVITADEMLELVHRKQGDEREITLVEAYFFAGQWHAMRGDKARAAELFRKTRELGLISYVEHRTAAQELARLEAAPR